MPNGIGTTNRQPSVFTALTLDTVVNFDSHGSLWGHDTVTNTKQLIADERANGTAIDEWNITARDGQPLRIVRLADPTFVDTICVFMSDDRTAVPA